METILINGNEHKVSKPVKEHIEWLIIQLKTKEKLANYIELSLDNLKRNQSAEIDDIYDYLKQLKTIET